MHSDLILSVFLLLLLFDPIGNITIFNGLLRAIAPKRRRLIVIREGLIAVFLLIIFVFVGEWVLAALRISTIALEITGGLMLFLIALQMVFPKESNGAIHQLEHEPLIVPMAIPLIAGPASLATVLLASQQSSQRLTMVWAILIAGGINILALLLGDWLAKIFGKTGMAAMERLMGLALTTMAVQMILTGIKKAFF